MDQKANNYFVLLGRGIGLFSFFFQAANTIVIGETVAFI